MPLQDGDQPRGDPQRQHEPGESIDPREGAQKWREQGQAARTGDQPAPRRGQATTSRAQR